MRRMVRWYRRCHWGRVDLAGYGSDGQTRPITRHSVWMADESSAMYHSGKNSRSHSNARSDYRSETLPPLRTRGSFML
ncbi:hypothetical protein RRG08_052436 [Elysia crispata]|uniref:Uncharacterized protein n=1 Tax=Elysia crispata TaxID=231223 RepID=A0AAE1E8G4_9GAST|nr:hypothetical protein RRG08_052436 [Elysia crispata]